MNLATNPHYDSKINKKPPCVSQGLSRKQMAHLNWMICGEFIKELLRKARPRCIDTTQSSAENRASH